MAMTSVTAGENPVGQTVAAKDSARIIEMLREGTKEEASLDVSDVAVKSFVSAPVRQIHPRFGKKHHGLVVILHRSLVAAQNSFPSVDQLEHPRNHR